MCVVCALPFWKWLKETQPNVFQANWLLSKRTFNIYFIRHSFQVEIELNIWIGFSVCDNVSVSVNVFQLFVLCAVHSNVWPSFSQLNVRCSCFCKPRLFSHQQIHQCHECGFAIISPTTTNLHERPSTTRWFVGSRIELITFKIFAIYFVGQTIERAFLELWRGNKITILKWSHQSRTGQSRPKNKAKFSVKVNTDFHKPCADGLI